MIDDLLIHGQNVMMEFQDNASATYSYFMAAKSGVEKMKKFFIVLMMVKTSECGY